MLNCGIYQIRNIFNGDIYIGQTTNFSKRRREHYRNLNKNLNKNPHLQKAFNKYGADNFVFEILLYCEPFELTRYEQKMVDILNPKYNILKECVETARGVKRSEETINLLSISHMGKSSGSYNPMYGFSGSLSPVFGRKQSEEEIEKRISKCRGKKRSDESRLKMSNSLKKYWENKKKKI